VVKRESNTFSSTVIMGYPHYATDGCELQAKIYVSAAAGRILRATHPLYRRALYRAI
jgi:hypothetical protein